MEFLALLLLFTPVLGALHQNVTFYTKPSCVTSEKEDSATIFSRYDSDSRDSFIALVPNARSARIFGLWWFVVKDSRTDTGLFGWTFNGDLDPAASPCNAGSIFELLQPQPENDADAEGSTTSPQAQFNYIMLYSLGPSELDGAPALTLYSEPNFRGTPKEAIFDAEGLEVEDQGQSLEESIHVKSLVFAPGAGGLDGLKGWTLYSEADYKGIVYHVTVDDEEEPEASNQSGCLYFISAIDVDSDGAGITIGSIRPGIHFDMPVSEGDAAVMGIRSIVADGRRQAGTPLKELIKGLSGDRDCPAVQERGSGLYFEVSDQILLSVAVAVAALVFLTTIAVIGLVFYMRSRRSPRDKSSKSGSKQLLGGQRAAGRRGSRISRELLIIPSQ